MDKQAPRPAHPPGNPDDGDNLARDLTELRLAEARLRESRDQLQVLFDQAGDAMFLAGLDGRLADVNTQACASLGYSREELLALNVTDVDDSISAGQAAELWRTLEHGVPQSLETSHRRKDGTVFPVEIRISRVHVGERDMILGQARDVTDRHQEARVLEARIRLSQYAQTHSSTELLQVVLDECEKLTDSQIGFFHFLDDDQEHLSLGAWSRRTLAEMCTAEGAGQHYPVSQAGVWVDALRQRRPVIHNDYARLPHRRGLPAGHAPVVRELVVPVFRAQRIVAICGVGNRASDYDQRDVETVTRLADEAWEIVSRKQAESRYRDVIATSPDGFWHVDRRGRLLDANRAYSDLSGYSREELLEMSIPDLEASEDAEQVAAHMAATIATGHDRFETQHRRKDGEILDVEVSTTYSGEAGGSFYVFLRDITARKAEERRRRQVEIQTRESQKMEAIGTLAAGIAHDFNNVLSGIMGLLDLAEADAGDTSALHDDLRQIRTAAERASDLVSQILTFGRRDGEERRPVRLAPIVTDAIKLLRASIPTSVEFRCRISDEPATVVASATQIHQVLMNLCTNAAHAMLDTGGVLEVDLTFQDGSDRRLAAGGVAAGYHAMLRVTDTGCGMDGETLTRIFEPYFTTKPAGEGSGLGLAVVHGIVRAHGGHIEVESTPGAGSTLTVYLPACQAEDVDAGPASTASLTGTERILLVDDEEVIVSSLAESLRRLGYDVTAATDPVDAVETFCAAAAEFDVVVTDQTMPGMMGTRLTEHVRQRRPEIPVILCSGLGVELDRPEGQAPITFLKKPFGLKDLAGALRRLLDEGRAG